MAEFWDVRDEHGDKLGRQTVPDAFPHGGYIPAHQMEIFLIPSNNRRDRHARKK